MLNKVEELLQKVDAFTAQTKEEVESFRIEYLGSKGILKSLFSEFKNVAPEQRKEFGQALNQLKKNAEEKVKALQSNLDSQTMAELKYGDLTRPGEPIQLGSRHPISIVKNKIIDVFNRIGFTISEGPEIEDDWHNFTALNLPEYHPARDMQDTFFIEKSKEAKDNVLLRTHTSSVQVRYMENNEPPIRTISPGRVFRNEDISARSHCIFHQIEGLYVDTDVSFADLKQTLLFFTKEMFGKSKIRLRPSYFPFTEPSAEVDIYWGLETETDYRITKGTGWLEIMGCGMVDPNVLKNCNIDPTKYSGYAFGMGIERIAMLLYQIPDIRMFYENDVRFLEQFKSSFLVLKKDIHIPEASGVDLAIVREYNDIYKIDDWNVYLINKKDVDLEMVVVVSQGFSETKKTSLLRKKLAVLPANSFAKVEFIQPDLFSLNNRFQVTFFEGNTLYEKTFTFQANTIKEGALRLIKTLNKKGILAK